MDLVILTVVILAAVYLEDRFERPKKINATKYLSRPANISRQRSPEIAAPRASNRSKPLEKANLSTEQLALFNLIETTKAHVFITGKAGSGKSVLLKYFRDNSQKNVVVSAPTGVAALNIGGQTIHALFRLKPGLMDNNQVKLDDQATKLLKYIDTLVIDEVSMVRADLMDAIDHRLRQAKSNSQAFGGVQVVLFGDLFQLPPIVSDEQLHKYFSDRSGYFFFNARVWSKARLEVYELSKIYRQKDEKFIEILNAVRIGRAGEQTLAELNKRVEHSVPQNGVITLASTNKSVRAINQSRLVRLPTKEYKYHAKMSGSIEKSALPTEEVLRLKQGAQVMLLNNDPAKRWVNGSLGTVHSLSANEVRVNVDGAIFSVAVSTWTKLRYHYNQRSRQVEQRPISSFSQFPLKLAWAVTIHKSQGQTYSRCVINLAHGTFAHGQAYVALSRCASLEGLYLTSPILPSDISVAPEIADFMRRAKPPPATKKLQISNFSKLKWLDEDE